MARRSANGVSDVNSTCNVLWVPRSGPYDVYAWLGKAAITEIVAQVREGNKARWLGRGDDNDVLGCSWNKDTTSPAGVFSLTLKSPTDYFRIIKPGDLVFIFMSDDQPHANRFDGTLVTVGIIDRITQSISTSGDGVDMRMVSINGRDFGAILQETSLVFDNAFAQLEQGLFTDRYWHAFSEMRSALSPAEAVLRFLHIIYDENATGSKMVNAQWRLSADADEALEDPEVATAAAVARSIPLMSLMDVTSFVQVPMFGYNITQGDIAIGEAGNVWSLLDTYRNGVVNEMFVDIRDYSVAERQLLEHTGSVAEAFIGAADVAAQKSFRDLIKNTSMFATAEGRDAQLVSSPSETDGVGVIGSEAIADDQPVIALVFRQLPYDQDAFAALPQVNAHVTEIFESDFGCSTHDVLNFFRIRFPVLEEGAILQELIYGIRVFPDSVFKYGLRRIEAESQFLYTQSFSSNSVAAGEAPKSEDFLGAFDYYIGLLSTWYAANDALLAGTINMRLRPDIRVGTRLRLTDDESVSYDFYVQGISHSFSPEPGASRTQLTVVRGVEVGGTGLVNNLKWTTKGSALPTNLVTHLMTTSSSVELIVNKTEKIVGDQITFELNDPDAKEVP